MKLKDPSLLRDKCYIDGSWISADSGEIFPVTNPANGETIASVPRMGEAETHRAIEAAQAAFSSWKDRTAKERANIVRKWYELIMANQDDLALLMTMEQGKPLAEAKGEVAYGASFVEWFAEECKRVYGDTIPEHLPGRRLVVTKEPIGVVAAITPWNFPIAMITRKCAPAIAAGCTVVVKPAEDTPLCAFALAELAHRAGIPKGVLNIVTGVAKQIGKAMTESTLVRKLTFTGSTPIGKLLMKQCADTVKKTSMELGGNAPFIVFDDADLDAAVEGAMLSKFRNAGQTCVCANRILVQEGVYDAFAEKLTKRVSELKVAPGTTEGSQQGPLINTAAATKVSELINDAVGKGAKTVIGGKPHDLGGNFFAPTVITGVTDDMRIFSEEIFGPVAPLYKFKTEEEAVRMANDTPFGLASYFYSRDIGRVWRVSRALEYGIVGINEGIISNEVAPFGGVKESGVGREGSKYGMEDFLEIKYLCMGGI
ncbi:NAD-dependent succinate-semialdehyde dehydrogenase [Kiloniella laminariae]|uniref:NAD-dependent succinate-semialdehyde dehydrogenase n=1 Tax=Kiloniella laminariae TaxID=454162 RepID=A0ABT4LK61_9PROT|nr:NAD-dependent succinate-semialdehyde dehydrogenase [Kiloniella laminariae]MCZ4281497.1 NAD-dependent succinate-semialdehyde dehydrogenase [Kiloniella laminariae]